MVPRGKGEVRDFGKAMYTPLFKRDNQQGPTTQHMELCSKLPPVTA